MTSLAHDTAPTRGAVTTHIRAQLPDLTPSGRRIAETVLDNPHGIVHLTVTDLADHTNTSVATVVRFCQDIGLRGFQDLKIRLASETAPPTQGIYDDVTGNDTPPVVLNKVIHSTARAITEAASTLDSDAFTHAVERLSTARRVLFAAVGTSSPLAQDAAYRFRTIGMHTEAPTDTHVQHVTAGLLDPGDVCLTISHTGQTQETLATTTAAKNAGASVIAITSFYRSPLTKLADLALVAGSRETNFRIEATTSRLLHTTVLDALHVAYTLTNPERAAHVQQRSADIITEHRI